MKERRGWEDKLGIDGDPYDAPPITLPEDDEETTEGIVEDYKYVKKKLKRAIKTNQEVVDILLKELRGNPSPRMAEVVARLLEGLSNSGMQILEATKTVAEIHKLMKEDLPKDSPQVTNIQKAIIIGRLDDLFKLNKAQQAAALVAFNEDPYGE